MPTSRPGPAVRTIASDIRCRRSGLSPAAGRANDKVTELSQALQPNDTVYLDAKKIAELLGLMLARPATVEAATGTFPEADLRTIV